MCENIKTCHDTYAIILALYVHYDVTNNLILLWLKKKKKSIICLSIECLVCCY